MNLVFVTFWGFQDPATPLMEAIVDLHNYVFFLFSNGYFVCFLFFIFDCYDF